MRKHFLNSNNLARNARLKTSDGSKMDNGQRWFENGKNQDVPISGWLAGSLIAEIKWVGSAHQIESKGSWTKVLINDAKLEHPRRLMNGDRIKVGSDQFIYTEE